MEAMQKISIKPGPPVEGNDFYGRESELKYAWQYYILNGVSVLLSAPRRIGKSSFSKKLLKMAEENGYKTLYLDLQGESTEGGFVKLFKEELQKEKWWESAKSNIGNTIISLFNSIEDFEIAGNKISINGDVWRNDTYNKIKQLIENAGDIIIVIDELTIFLNHLFKQENGREKVEFFLEWLRKFRQVSETKVRWIFCSSVGIENFASMHQLSKHLNDLKSVPIGAFSEYEAKDFISRLDVDEKVQFTEEDIQYILDKLGWHLPFFIHLLVEKINFLICVEGCQLSNSTIDEAYNRLIDEDHFNSWDERLKEYYDFEDNARKILKLCAELPTGRSREDVLANLAIRKGNIEKIESALTQSLKMLKNDGYLIEDSGKYAFRSPLLRDFWYNKYIK
ncbi:ATP-binding protein [Bacteroidia bacterium]|nr:ATP-binding protein [Bacteroidia bacterium]